MKKEKITNAEYHSRKEYLSTSVLKAFAVSALHGKYYLEKEHQSTPQMAFGTLWHSVMEGAKIFAFEAPINPTTGKCYGVDSQKYLNAYNEAFEGLKQNETLASQEDSDKINKMKTRLFDIYEDILSVKGESENSYFSEDEEYEFLQKCRPDWISEHPEFALIIDWKTTSLTELSENKLIWEIKSRDYDLQYFLYKNMLDKYYNLNFNFAFCFTQTVEPYESIMVNPVQFYGEGRVKYNRALQNYKLHLKNEYPALYEGKVNEYGIIELINERMY
jgi:ATP-dependent exoDNAse (exonuclease V) beta subunit